NAYARAHGADAARHQVVAESDFGAGRIYGFNIEGPARAAAAEARIAGALAPLDIAHMDGEGGPGPDVIAIARAGATWAWLGQDGSDYFDLHHTPDDTLDKIDPAALAQNSAAYAVFAYLSADAEGDFGSAAAAPAASRRYPARCTGPGGGTDAAASAAVRQRGPATSARAAPLWPPSR